LSCQKKREGPPKNHKQQQKCSNPKTKDQREFVPEREREREKKLDLPSSKTNAYTTQYSKNRNQTPNKNVKVIVSTTIESP
jgi:hypothetical protein